MQPPSHEWVSKSHSVMSDSLWPHGLQPPGSSVHGILQARILEWAAVPFSRGSSQARGCTQVSHTAADSLPSEPPGKPSEKLKLAHTEKNPHRASRTNEREIRLVLKCSSFWLLLLQPSLVYSHIYVTIWDIPLPSPELPGPPLTEFLTLKGWQIIVKYDCCWFSPRFWGSYITRDNCNSQ